MANLSQKIMQIAEEAPEGAPLVSNTLLNLGKRAAVDQALSRLARNGRLLRIGSGRLRETGDDALRPPAAVY